MRLGCALDERALRRGPGVESGRCEILADPLADTLWETAEPVPLTTRLTYPIRWRHDNGVLMSFTATMHVADLWQDLTWHDWVSADAETLRELAAANA